MTFGSISKKSAILAPTNIYHAGYCRSEKEVLFLLLVPKKYKDTPQDEIDKLCE